MSRKSWKQEWIDEAAKDKWFVVTIVTHPFLGAAYGAAAGASWLRRRMRDSRRR